MRPRSPTSEVVGVVHYRFVVSGSNDNGRFVVRTAPTLVVAGITYTPYTQFRKQFAHLYVMGSCLGGHPGQTPLGTGRVVAP